MKKSSSKGARPAPKHKANLAANPLRATCADRIKYRVGANKPALALGLIGVGCFGAGIVFGPSIEAIAHLRFSEVSAWVLLASQAGWVVAAGCFISLRRKSRS